MEPKILSVACHLSRRSNVTSGTRLTFSRRTLLGLIVRDQLAEDSGQVQHSFIFHFGFSKQIMYKQRSDSYRLFNGSFTLKAVHSIVEEGVSSSKHRKVPPVHQDSVCPFGHIGDDKRLTSGAQPCGRREINRDRGLCLLSQNPLRVLTVCCLLVFTTT
jgi:hypothetical protein